MKGEKYLDDWVERMRATGNKHLVKVANTVMAFCSGILSWYDHRISNGKVEGINNKVSIYKCALKNGGCSVCQITEGQAFMFEFYRSKK